MFIYFNNRAGVEWVYLWPASQTGRSRWLVVEPAATQKPGFLPNLWL
ncbi:MAG: hypothetical protein ACMG55_00985 [Microcoleus sp.]